MPRRVLSFSSVSLLVPNLRANLRACLDFDPSRYFGHPPPIDASRLTAVEAFSSLVAGAWPPHVSARSVSSRIAASPLAARLGLTRLGHTASAPHPFGPLCTADRRMPTRAFLPVARRAVGVAQQLGVTRLVWCHHLASRVGIALAACPPSGQPAFFRSPLAVLSRASSIFPFTGRRFAWALRTSIPRSSRREHSDGLLPSATPGRVFFSFERGRAIEFLGPLRGPPQDDVRSCISDGRFHQSTTVCAIFFTRVGSWCVGAR